MANSLRGLFVTGTDTGVGKTHVTTMIARQLMSQNINVGVYKPVCSGSERNKDGREIWTDVVRLSDSVEGRFPHDWICPQRFSAGLAPPSAARMEKRRVDSQKLRSGLQRWNGEVDVVLVEGVGGWLCPVAENETVADLASDIGFPVLIVAGLELGAVNHTLLAVESVRQRHVPIAGIVLNQHLRETDPEVADATIAGIREHSAAPLLATIPHGDFHGLPPGHAFRRIDWIQLTGPNPAKPEPNGRREVRGQKDGEFN